MKPCSSLSLCFYECGSKLREQIHRIRLLNWTIWVPANLLSSFKKMRRWEHRCRNIQGYYYKGFFSLQTNSIGILVHVAEHKITWTTSFPSVTVCISRWLCFHCCPSVKKTALYEKGLRYHTQSPYISTKRKRHKYCNSATTQSFREVLTSFPG